MYRYKSIIPDGLTLRQGKDFIKILLAHHVIHLAENNHILRQLLEDQTHGYWLRRETRVEQCFETLRPRETLYDLMHLCLSDYID